MQGGDVERVRSGLLSEFDGVVHIHCLLPESMPSADTVIKAIHERVPPATPNMHGSVPVTWIERTARLLDLDGSNLYEHLEGLFTGFTYAYDAHQFFRDHMPLCEMAVAEQVGVAALAEQCGSIGGMVEEAAHYGAARLWQTTLRHIIDDMRWSLQRTASKYGTNI